MVVLIARLQLVPSKVFTECAGDCRAAEATYEQMWAADGRRWWVITVGHRQAAALAPWQAVPGLGLLG